MLFHNVTSTLKGPLLVAWKAFVQSNNAAVEAATDDEPFNWPLEFEKLVVTTEEFQRLEVSWRALSKHSDTPLTLMALMHAYKAAFVSWGRHALLIAEPSRSLGLSPGALAAQPGLHGQAGVSASGA